MSKSTPLNQLPFPGPGGGVNGGGGPSAAPNMQQQPVNEPHRQIIAQAQQAAQTYALPQSTTIDNLRDMDPTIQEAYNFMSGGTPSPSAGGGATPPPHQDVDTVGPPGGFWPPAGSQQQQQQQQHPLMMLPPLPLPLPSGPSAAAQYPASSSSWWQALPLPTTTDAQLAVAVMAAFVFVQSTRASAILEYVLPSVFDRVPHGDLVIKAIILGIIVLIMTRVFGDKQQPLNPFTAAAMAAGLIQ
jgi:hypothetical protein